VADNSKEILLKLVIDDKEVGRSLVVVDKNVQNVSTSVINANKNLDQTSQEIKQVEDRGASLGYNLGEEFDGIYVTTGDLIDRLKDLKERFEQASIGGEEYNYLKRQIQEVSGHLKRVQGDLKETNNQTQSLTRTNQFARAETGAMSGAVYSMSSALTEVHPALGEVMRRLSPFANGLSSATIRGGGFSAMIKGLSSSLMGPVGLGLAITGVAMLVKQIPGLFDDGTESIEKHKEEVEKLKKEYEGLSKAAIEFKKHQLGAKLEKLEGEAEFVKPVTETRMRTDGRLMPTEDILLSGDPKKYKETLQEIAKVKEELGIATGAASQSTTQLDNIMKSEYDSIKQVTDALKILNDQYVTTRDDDERKKIDKRIKELNEREAELRGKANQEVFKKLHEKTEIEQAHQMKMLAIAGAGAQELLGAEVNHLNEKINLYQKYGHDTLALEYSLQEKRAELENERLNERVAKMEEHYERLRQLRIEHEQELTDLFNDMPDEILKDIKFGDTRSFSNDPFVQLDAWYAAKNEEIKAYENYEEMKFALDEEYANRKLDLYGQNLGMIKSLFGKHTTAYHLLTASQTLIDTYQSANAAYKSTAAIPVVGPALAPFAAAAATAFGLAQVASIRKTSMPGFEKGGAVVGEDGVEIIAPMKEYSEGWGEIVRNTTLAVERSLQNMAITVGAGSFSDTKILQRLDTLSKSFQEYALSAKAFGDEEIERLDIKAQFIRNRGTY